MIDIPTDGSIVVADVQAGDWSLRITRDGEMYAAILSGAEFGSGLEVHRWAGLARVLETVEAFLRNRELTNVWAELRAALKAAGVKP
jgi:hypothetical protein